MCINWREKIYTKTMLQRKRITGKREQSVESVIWKAEQRQCRLIVWELGWPAGWEGGEKRAGWEKEGRGGFQRGKSTTPALPKHDGL